MSETASTNPATGHEPAPGAGFVHLHVHTEHSKQDGLAKIGQVIDFAVREGMSAIAQTDHGNKAGAFRFANAARKAGIKPILGEEVYMALVPDGTHLDADARDDEGNLLNPILSWDDPRVRFARTAYLQPDAESGVVKRNTNNHLTVLARNQTGWRNLCALTNAAEDSFYGKPLIDYALLRKHGSSRWDEQTKTLVEGEPGDGGLIVLSGCLGGPVASYVAMARGRNAEGKTTFDESILDKARANLDHLIACVGRENVYVEVMEHGLSAEGRRHIAKLMDLAEEARVQVVATNDAHFVGGCDHQEKVDADEHGNGGHIHHHGCDADAHDSWLVNGENARLKAGKKISKNDPNRWRFNGNGYWLRTEAEMRSLHGAERWNAAYEAKWQQAVSNTVALAERIEDDVIPHVPLRLPKFPIPDDVMADWETERHTPAAEANPDRYATPANYYLHRKVAAGLARRFPNPTPEQRAEIKARRDYEFSIILPKGIADYFLIVGDVLDWARSTLGLPTPGPDGHLHHDRCYADPSSCPVPPKKPILVGPGRGSAGGSLVAYAVSITQVDPLRHHLLFERFLDPERVGMPDIDVDFEAARRGEVYEYLAATYGARFVARIGAFQVAKTKRAIKDAARVLELDHWADQINKLVPVHQGSPQGFDMLFERARDKKTGQIIANPEGSEFRAFIEYNQPAQEIVALAEKFENVVAGEGIHAAGIVIADEPLDTLLPLRRDRKTESAVRIMQWDGPDADDFGLLKLDALSIENLDYLAAAVTHIERRTGEVIDLANYRIPDPDDATNPMVVSTWDGLRDGRTAGVFQLESRGMTELCVQVSPNRYSDLSALVALYRPGPMGGGMHVLYADRKNGRAPLSYDYLTDDPAEAEVIASVLDDTFGVVAYQEQLMRLAEYVACYTPAEKNKLRKVVAKKKPEEMEPLRQIFMERGSQEIVRPDGTIKPAFSAQTLTNLWVTFEASGAYLFNAAHSVAYGYLGFVTAYIKANWPVEYGAAILGVTVKDEKRRSALLALRSDGIETFAPDVNASQVDTAPDDRPEVRGVRLGLKEVRDVGSNAEAIVAERETNGPFTGLGDFVRRVRIPVSAVEALIEAGAFDEIEPNASRRALKKVVRAYAGLFSGGGQPTTLPAIPAAGEWTMLDRAQRQRFMVGVSLGEHPVSHYKSLLQGYRFNAGVIERDTNGMPLSPLPLVLRQAESQDEPREPGARKQGGPFVVTSGLLTAWEPRITRKGTRMASFTIETATAEVSGVGFARALETLGDQTPRVGDLVAVSGFLRSREVIKTGTDAETGEEIEEVSITRELNAERFEIVHVPDHTTAEHQRPDDSDQRATVIDMAAIRRSRLLASVAKPRKTRAAAPREQTAGKSRTSSSKDTNRPRALNPETPEGPTDESARGSVGESTGEPEPLLSVGWLDVQGGARSIREIEWLTSAPQVLPSRALLADLTGGSWDGYEVAAVLSPALVPSPSRRLGGPTAPTGASGHTCVIIVGDTRAAAQARCTDLLLTRQIAEPGDDSLPTADPVEGPVAA